MDSQLDLEEINKQMLFFQNDFKTNPQQQYEKDVSAINFQPPPDSPMQTTQIKKPTKSSGHRNDINDKLNNMNMETPMINDMYSNNGNIPNMMPQFSRNNSNYMELEKSSSSSANPTANQFAQYYNNNYSTLQGDNSQHPRIQQDDISNIIMQQNNFNQQGNINPNINPNTHTGGMTFINARNIYETNAFNPNNQSNSMPGNNINNIKINDTGFHKIDEKRIDYRQNMNNKIDNFIFENPNATPFNPILQQQLQHQPITGFQRDTRMVIQDSSKDYYRQESNSRMSQYSPLSRASNVPINIANMSVNDFYANMQTQTPGISANPNIPTQDDNKAILNSRMGQYAPLARNIQFQSQSQSQNNSIPNQTPNQTPIQQQQNIVFGQKQIPNQIPYTKPKVWNPNEVNLKTNNVYFNQLPVMSNK